MNTGTKAILFAAGVIAAAMVAYSYMSKPEDVPVLSVSPPIGPDAAHSSGVGAPPPPVRHPIEQIETAAVELPLPPQSVTEPAAPPDVDGSDALVVQALQAVLASPGWQDVLITDGFIRRVVVIVDNLPREQLPIRRSPLRPAQGSFEVDGGAGGHVIAARNAARYEPYVQMAEGVDMRRLVATYVRLYPLFQQAYEDLGYPGHYFNDRLIAVIDNVLAAPQATGTLALVQPKVLYKFADPRLEALSAGQKIMLRMGDANAMRIRAILQALRKQLAGARPDS